MLKRYAYPNRYAVLVPRFARPIPQICMIANHTMNFVYDNWHHLLESFEQNWLSPEHLQTYANYVHQSGAPLDNCWGFVDGTVRPVCRPQQGQRELYNGHKRVHGIKFQSIVVPNGMIANLFGPIMGRRHDAYMLARSGVLDELQQRLALQLIPCVFTETQPILYECIFKNHSEWLISLLFNVRGRTCFSRMGFWRHYKLLQVH